MSSIISETKNINENNPEDLREETENGSLVSTHIYLKPTPSTGTLEKKVVLRRIRHRKCMNKVRAAVKALVGSPSAASPGKVSAHQEKWVDDAFAAP